jgi:hypothetical protein
MIRAEAPTYNVAVYVAGPHAEAERICREYVLTGLCVTVEPVEFIYTGGQERGVRVGLINYPRFPAEPAEIFAKAEDLAMRLIEGMHQHSASIVATDKTVWLSRRPDSSANSASPTLTRYAAEGEVSPLPSDEAQRSDATTSEDEG